MAEKRVPMTMRDFFFDDPFFKSSWEDFDKVRDAMFQESRDIWKRFDEDFRQMACMSNNIMLDTEQREERQRLEQSSSSRMERKESTERSSSNNAANQPLARQDSIARWEQGWMFPRRWMLPSLHTSPLFRDMDLFKERDSEVIRIKEDKDKLEVSLDTSQYRPDELRVSVSGREVCVEGRHEEKSEDGHRMVARQFVRRYTLPEGARPEDVNSNLSSDGVLVVTAKKSNPALEVKINQN